MDKDQEQVTASPLEAEWANDTRMRESNNWLWVPEFNVSPTPELNFRDYVYHCSPSASVYASAISVIVGSCRKKLMGYYPSHVTAHDAWCIFLEGGMNGNEINEMPIDSKTRNAVYYFMILDALRTMINARTSGFAANWFAEAASLLAAWMVDDPAQPLPQRMRELAKRRPIKASIENFEAFAKVKNYPRSMSRKAFIIEAAEHFKSSDRQVERWLANLKKLQNLPT